MKKFSHNPISVLFTIWCILMFNFIIYLSYIQGKQNWYEHISEIEQKNLATDGEISCIMYKWGFQQVGLFDDPTIAAYIKSGFTNTPKYCRTCIDIQ